MWENRFRTESTFGFASHMVSHALKTSVLVLLSNFSADIMPPFSQIAQKEINQTAALQGKNCISLFIFLFPFFFPPYSFLLLDELRNWPVI